MNSDSLLPDIAQGNERAMELFYRQHAQAVYGFVLKKLKDSMLATEVMNETMMEVWKKAHSFEGRSKERTWLFSIANFKAIDALRRQKDFAPEEDIDQGVEDHCPLSDAIAGSQNRAFVEQCLNRLKAAQRHIVYLTFYEGLAYSDIAEILSIPSGTVKTRMMHAKQKLKQCLASLFSDS